jgi:uroporphyrinogen III methyltransferase/synthase
MGDLRSLAPWRIAAIGAGTAQALAEHHLAPDFVPAVATTASLGREMATQLDLRGKTVLRVRGNLGDRRLEEALEEAGAHVLPLCVYSTRTAVWPDGLREKIFSQPPHVVLFTSGSTADGLVEMLSKEELGRLLAKAKIFSIGPTTSQVIRTHGLKVFAEAKVHTIPGLVDELVARFRTRSSRRNA